MKTSSRVTLAFILILVVWLALSALSIYLILHGVPIALCAAVQGALTIIAAYIIGDKVI